MRLPMALVVGVLMLPGVTLAQDGLRSASLPERSALDPRPSLRADQFRARPDPYRTRRTPLEPRRFRHPGAWWPSVIVVEEWIEPVVVYRRELIEQPIERPASVEAPPPAAPAPVMAPGPPKTFYVIPGCYAGDRQPSPDQLPARCDLTLLRVIPPQ